MEIVKNIKMPKFAMTFDVKNNIEFYSAAVYDFCNYQYDLKKIEPESISVAVKLLKDISTIKLLNEKPVKIKILYNIQNLHFERFGLLLMNFLNADFSSFEKAYNTFFYAYGFEAEKGKKTNEEMVLGNGYFESQVKFVEVAKKWFYENQDNLEMYQHYIREAVDYIYNLHGDMRHKDVDKKIKFQAYSITEIPFKFYCDDYDILQQNIYSEFINMDTDNLDNAIKYLNKEQIIVANSLTYMAKTIAGMACISLNKIVNECSMPIKICQNCGKYFMPQARNDEKYCDYINLDGSSCKRDGAKQVYNAKKEDVLKEYTKIYQAKFMRMKRNPSNLEYKKQFNDFTTKGNLLKKDFRNGNINEKQFSEKLKELEKNT